MELEINIKNVIDQKLSDGTIEKLVAQKFEEGVKNAIDGLFRSYGDVTKVIEEKIKSVMLDRLDKYDYSDYIVKLDFTLQEILKQTTLDNKIILSHFKDLMLDDAPKKIKMSEIFNKFADFVQDNVKTDGLGVSYDDGVSYNPVEITFSVEECDKPSWSIFDRANVYFECEHDEDMNKECSLSRWNEGKNKTWALTFDHNLTFDSLRRLDSFSIFLIKLSQAGTEIEIDDYSDSIEITPSKEPEPSFS
jgi:hypothetical protein